jgi:anti-sigma B factor antagonist
LIYDEFRLEVVREHDLVRLCPAGELDMATVARVEDELRALVAAGVGAVVLDLRGLTFMDSTGLSLVLRWTYAAQQDGFDFSLIAGGRPVHRVFELAGMADRVHFRAPEG